MRRSKWTRLALCLVGLTAFSASAFAIPITPDTFEDGTTMGWGVPGPSPNPPFNSANGGPGGAGDAFLRLIANGSAGPGGRLVVINEAQWQGDYLAAGVTTIRMDVNNFTNTDLVLRLLFEDFGAVPGPPVNLALTTTGVAVPGGSGWMSVEFDLTNLTTLIGTAAGALSDVNALRIFHNPAADFPGPGVGIPVIVAELGIDNIEALRAVPEPGLGALLLVAGAVAARRRYRRGRVSESR
jgi:hypothetical protein